MIKTVKVVVTGRVQGVAFRYWTRREAGARQLTGFVRNRTDGSVEALFSGDSEQVEAMVAACWQGPPLAKVSSVECIIVEPGTLQSDGFHVIE